MEMEFLFLITIILCTTCMYFNQSNKNVIYCNIHKINTSGANIV